MISAFAIKAIRGATVDVATFRKRAGYSDPAFVSAVAQAPVKLAWRAAWPKSAELYFSILESLCYGVYYDMHVRNAVKERRDVQSLFAVQQLDELMKEVDEELKSENAGCPELGHLGGLCASEEDDKEKGSGDENTLDTHPIVMSIAKGLDDMGEQKLAIYKSQARRIVNTHVELLPETLPDDEILQKTQETEAGKVRGDASVKDYVGIFYDPKHAGHA